MWRERASKNQKKTFLNLASHFFCNAARLHIGKKKTKKKIIEKLSENQYRRFGAAETHLTRQCRKLPLRLRPKFWFGMQMGTVIF